jgi:hypothetical protein
MFGQQKLRERTMRTLAVILSLAICGIALSSDVTPASATKMNGKCCQSSDGGRSYRTRVALARRAIPHTCSAYAALCIRDSRARPDAIQLCRAAKAQCLGTGVHVGPYSGRQFAGMARR